MIKVRRIAVYNTMKYIILLTDIHNSASFELTDIGNEFRKPRILQTTSLVYFNKAKCYKRTFIDRKQYLVRQFILLRLRNTKTM